VAGSQRPSPGTKYEVSAAPPSVVGGRPVQVVEFRDEGVLLERLSLDVETGLLLRREQFDGGSAPSRTMTFDTLEIGTQNAAPRIPAKVKNAAASPVPLGRLSSGVSAPSTLPGSYKRLGVYKRSGMTQVLYSDGLYDLSVFQEEGRLDRSDLPEGERVQVGKRAGWHYVWPGGHVVLWEARGVVHTVVSDAPLDQVMAAVRSLPDKGGSASLLRRLRQVCRALVQPLS
jgi:sigma-E factor negative regulatory protein RseB